MGSAKAAGILSGPLLIPLQDDHATATGYWPWCEPDGNQLTSVANRRGPLSPTGSAPMAGVIARPEMEATVYRTISAIQTEPDSWVW